MSFDTLQMHALIYITHIYNDMRFDTLQMQSTSCFLLLSGTERCYPLADCSACEPTASMGFGVMESELVITMCV